MSTRHPTSGTASSRRPRTGLNPGLIRKSVDAARGLRLAVALVATALFLAACGSTAQQLPGEASGAISGAVGERAESVDGSLEAAGTDAATPGVPRASGTGDGAAPSSGGRQTAAQRGAAGGEAREPGPATAGQGASAPGKAPTSSARRGVTDDTITVAFAWLDDRNETNETFGAETDFADPRQVFDVMVEWVNANGGVNGRELVPYYRPYNTGEYLNQQFWEALCTEFTQDGDVHTAVLESVNEQLVACMAKGGVPAVNASPTTGLDAQSSERYRGFLYQTSGLDLTQNAVLTARGNVAMGHLTPESTVGVVSRDDPSYARAAEAFEAELAKHGIEVAETALVNFWGGDLGTAQISNAVLRFRQLGVDRVAAFDSNGVMWWQFASAAEAQAYRPSYVLNAASYAEYWARSGLMPRSQIEGAKGVGTNAVLHIHRESEPYPPPGRAICREILDAAGMPAGSEDNEGTQVSLCDMVRLTKVALDRAGDLSPAGLQAAIESLGRTFQPGQTFGSYYGPGHHAGAGTYYTLEYVADCDCFRMTSDVLNIPGTPQ